MSGRTDSLPARPIFVQRLTSTSHVSTGQQIMRGMRVVDTVVSDRANQGKAIGSLYRTVTPIDPSDALIAWVH